MIFLIDPDVVQTEEICIEAVKLNGRALRDVQRQTEAMCMEAVKQNGFALKYVKKQTEAICMEAVKQDGCALKYVKKQTETICIEAVKQNPFALRYVKNQTDAMCLEVLALFYFGQAYNFTNIYHAIKYPSPQLVTVLLKLYPERRNTITAEYATNIMKIYKIGRKTLINIGRHAVDILYRPNNVNALQIGHTKWHITTNNAKILFLMV
jgi:Domain of unknown function (DUF4116)